jgi:hypothetical protein
MKNKILQQFEISTPEIELAVDLIIGLTQGRQTSSTALAGYLPGSIDLSSKIRKIERFYSKAYVDSNSLLNAIQKMFGEGKFKLVLDRTNWEFGNSDINAFVAFASRGEIGTIIGLKMLENNGGNSNGEERIELAKEIIERCGIEKIKVLLGDREFLSIKFAAWLIAAGLPFAIRAKENLEFVQPYLRHATKAGKMFRDVVLGKHEGLEIRCDVSIKKLADEYLIVVSHKVNSPLQEYKNRWCIERFFRMLKTGGFNIENTKITDPQRLMILFLMCSIAYLLCAKIGVYRHDKVRKMKWKRLNKC